MTSVIDLRAIRGPTTGDLAELQGYLLQLEGQPFLFSRVSYGDEFTLHFGTLQEYASGKTRRARGSYVLNVRASSWRLHSMPQGRILYHGTMPRAASHSSAHASDQELDGSALITPDARVVSADILGFRTSWGIELGLSFSDGSTFFVTPLPPEADGPADKEPDLPTIADWELFTPHGRVLLVGPGFSWQYADAGNPSPVSNGI